VVVEMVEVLMVLQDVQRLEQLTLAVAVAVVQTLLNQEKQGVPV
jgi:biotin-(acetyl-CoA carboxylase) ligase